MLEYASQFLNTFMFMTLPMSIKWLIALLLLLISSSMASACCCQNSTGQISVEELRLMLSKLCLDGNGTVYLLIPISSEALNESNFAVGAAPKRCDCKVDYKTAATCPCSLGCPDSCYSTACIGKAYDWTCNQCRPP